MSSNTVCEKGSLPTVAGSAGLSGGKSALGSLSKEISQEGSWRDLSEDEQRELIENSEAYKKENKSKKVEKVLASHQGNNIERTMVGLNAEVST